MLVFFDVETTGIPDFKAPSDAPHQPHMVQLGALLVEPDTRIERAAVNSPQPGAVAGVAGRR